MCPAIQAVLQDGTTIEVDGGILPTLPPVISSIQSGIKIGPTRFEKTVQFDVPVGGGAAARAMQATRNAERSQLSSRLVNESLASRYCRR